MASPEHSETDDAAGNVQSTNRGERLGWEELAREFGRLPRHLGPLSGEWTANEGSESYGRWLLKPSDAPKARAEFALLAVKAIAKMGIPPIPIPTPLEHDPNIREQVRLLGGTDNDEVLTPHGLGEADKDAVDPSTRAWLEHLRERSSSFQKTGGVTLGIGGREYRSIRGTIPDLWEASEVFCTLRARDDIQASLEKDPALTRGDSPAGHKPPQTEVCIRGKRTPDLRSSHERIELVNTLARELATLKRELSRFQTSDGLKKRYPAFVLWQHLDENELKELAEGVSFKPRAYAENLTLRKFGLTSRDTLKKDRRKLRKASKTSPLA